MFTITIPEQLGVDRVGEAVRTGLPFARGAVIDSSTVTLARKGGKNIPAQFLPLAYWPDGSVRWLLASFQVDLVANEVATVQVDKAGRSPEEFSEEAPGGQPVMAADTGGQIEIDTGVIKVRVGGESRDSFVVENAQAKPILQNRPALSLATADGATHTGGIPDSVELEDNGPICATVLLAGPMQGSGGSTVFRYETRLRCWRGQSHIEAEHTLLNVGDAPVVEVDAINIELKAAQPFRRYALAGADRCIEDDLQAGDTATIEQKCHFWQEIYRTEDGDHHYKVLDSDFSYKVTLNGKEIDNGEKSQGWCLARADDLEVGIAVGDFWEHGPKAIAITGNGTIGVALYPRYEYDPSQPRPNSAPTAKWIPEWGRGGASLEKLEKDLQLTKYSGPPRIGPLRFGRTRAITHDLFYYFGLDGAPALSDRKLAARRLPLVGLVDPPYLCATEAMNWITPANPAQWPVFEQALIEGFARYQSEAIEYGLLHWGDIKLSYGAYATAPGSYANHEYDTAHGLLVQFARGGDCQCWHRATQVVRHVADLDVDQLEGGARMHGYMESGEHHEECHTQHALDHSYVEGLLDHYCFTGDRRSLRAAKRIASSCKRIPEWLEEHGVAGIDCRTTARACIVLLCTYDITRSEEFLGPARQVVQMLIDYARDPLVGLQGSLGWRPWLGEGEHMAEHLQELLARYHFYTGDHEALSALRTTMDFTLAKWDRETETYFPRPDRIGHPPNRLEPPTGQPLPGEGQMVNELPLAYLAGATGEIAYLHPLTVGLKNYGRGMEKAIGDRAFPLARLLSMHVVALIESLKLEPEKMNKHTLRQCFTASLQEDMTAVTERGPLEAQVHAEVDFTDSPFGHSVLQTTQEGWISYESPPDILEYPGTLCFWVSQDHDLKSALGMRPLPRGLVHISGDEHLANALDVHLTYNEMWVRLYDHRGWLTACLGVPVPYWRPGEWHHVAVTWNRFTLTAYVNGIRMAQDRAWLVQGGQKVIHVGWRPLNWFAESRFFDLRLFRAPLPGYKIHAIYDEHCPYSPEQQQAMARYRDDSLWTNARGGGNRSLEQLLPVLAADRRNKDCRA